MNTEIRLLVTSLLLSLAACGGGADGDGTKADAGGDDGGPVDAGFDPDETYAGEGDACRFSIECGPSQLCVDDSCVRHERLSPETLEFSELRVLNPGPIASSPLYTRAPIPWEDVMAGASEAWMLNYTHPGPDTEQLVFLIRRLRQPVEHQACQVGVLGAQLRVLALDDFDCHTASTSSRGEVAIAGLDLLTGRVSLALFDAEDHLVYRASIPPEIEDEVREAYGDDLRLPVVDSVHIGRDHVFVSLLHTRYTEAFGYESPGADRVRVTFAGVDDEGTWSVVRPGGELGIPGADGWIVHDATGYRAVMSQNDETTAGNRRTSVIDLRTGAVEMVDAVLGPDRRFQQRTADDWVVTVAHRCSWYAFGPSLELRERTLLELADCPGDTLGGYYLTRAWVGKPIAPLVIGNRTVTAARFVEGPFALELTDDDDQPVARLEVGEADLGRSRPYQRGFGFVSRYGLSVEGNYGVYAVGAPFVWIEYALVRRGE